MREVLYDEVHDSQEHFRVLLDSMARPGLIWKFEDPKLTPPPELQIAPAAVAMALLNADVTFTTAGFSDSVTEYLTLNTHSRRAGAQEADFLFFADGDAHPEVLAAAKTGLPTYPEWGATAVVQVEALSDEPLEGGMRVQVRGPGVDGAAHFFTRGLHPVFLGALKDKNQEFPMGVDLMLTCGARVVSIPRSSQVEWR